jgi:hypothetical protein
MVTAVAIYIYDNKFRVVSLNNSINLEGSVWPMIRSLNSDHT